MRPSSASGGAWGRSRLQDGFNTPKLPSKPRLTLGAPSGTPGDPQGSLRDTPGYPLGTSEMFFFHMFNSSFCYLPLGSLGQSRSVPVGLVLLLATALWANPTTELDRI